VNANHTEDIFRRTLESPRTQRTYSQHFRSYCMGTKLVDFTPVDSRIIVPFWYFPNGPTLQSN